MTSSTPADPSDDAPLDARIELDPAAPAEVAVEPAGGFVAPPAPMAEAERIEKLAAAREQILASLRSRQTIQPPLAWALLVGGALLMVVIGAIFAVLCWLITSIAFDSFSVRTWFLLYLVALVPFLVYTERRAREGFFTFASGDVDLTRDESGAEYLIERGASHLRSFVDALFWPPRAFVAGLHALRRTPSRGLERVLPEAADTLTLMLTLDGGVKIKDLAPPGTEPGALMPVLKWLDAHDYIGISTKGDRVWVSSPAKKRFAAEGIRVPKVDATV